MTIDFVFDKAVWADPQDIRKGSLGVRKESLMNWGF